MKIFKNSIRIFWLLLMVGGLTSYIMYPEFFTAEILKSVLHNNASLILSVYIFLSCIRALLLLPSTIFVLMGTALYPENPWFVLSISMIGIVLGATLIYFSSKVLTPDQLFKGKNLSKMEGVHKKMEKYGFVIVLFWSFFPMVPTDLICFVAGTTRMTFWKFISALFIGEFILVILYIWTGKALLDILFV